MNREQEHNALKQELISTTPSLDDVFTKAQARMRKRNIRNRVITPLSTCLAVLLVFVGLVNFSPAVAMAMEGVPGLQRLAEFVSFSPSLSEAVENEFVQGLELEQLVGDDVIMRVEYVIVDGQQIHIFYSLDSQVYTDLGVSVGARGASTTEIADCCLETWMTCCYEFIYARMFLAPQRGTKLNDLRQLTIGFEEGMQIPTVVIWEGEVTEGNFIDARTIGRYMFTIVIEEVFAIQESYEVNYSFILDGQGFTITTVELNPAHTRVNLDTDWENNTKILSRLIFYMKNERGERFDPPKPESFDLINLPAGGADFDGPWRLEDHFLNTAFFSESESLVIVILGAEWLDSETTMLEEPIEIRMR